MIVATTYLILTLFGGGGLDLYSIEYLQPKIEQYVVAEDRQDILVDLLKAEQKKQKAFNKQATTAGKKMLKINKDYDATAADFSAVSDGIEKQLLSMQERHITLRFALKKNMTREEWASVFAQSK